MRRATTVAVKLQSDSAGKLTSPATQPTWGSGQKRKSMNQESQARTVAIVLFLLTLAAVIFAGFNLQTERKATAPNDGVSWVENSGVLVADDVEPDGPGARGGIKLGDQLIEVNGQEIKNTSGLERQLYRTGIWQKASYSLVRH